MDENTAPAEDAGQAPEAPAAPTADWREAISDPVRRGFAENKGWESLDDAIESYRNLEKFHGVSEDRLAKIPDFKDAEATAAFYRKLGAPESPDGYEIALPEGADESAEAFLGAMKGAFHEAGLSKRQAEAVAGKYQEIAAAEQARAQAAREAAAKAAADEFNASPDRDAIKAQAQLARQAFNVSDEAIDQLEAAWGLAPALTFLADLAQKAGLAEDNFAQGQGTGLRPSQAAEKLERRKQDPAFAKLIAEGDADALQEWGELNAAVAAGLDIEMEGF